MKVEDLEYPHAGSVTFALTSVSPACLLDSVGCVLLVSLTALVPTILPCPLCRVPELCLMFGCESLYLLHETPEEAFLMVTELRYEHSKLALGIISLIFFLFSYSTTLSQTCLVLP